MVFPSSGAITYDNNDTSDNDGEHIIPRANRDLDKV